MAVIKVTPDELRAEAKKVRDKAAEYQQLYKTELLSKNLGDLANVWWGEDQSAYSTRVKEFEPKFNNMYQLMIDYADLLDKAAGEYDRNRTDLATQIKQR